MKAYKSLYSREQILILLDYWTVQKAKGNRDAKDVIAELNRELAKLK